MDDHLPPPVVLLDEIDKADIDFPNDLLLELDLMEFEIQETDDGTGNPIKIKARKEKKPLIIITSNDEKPLPAAFLRRCLFHFINYPGKEMLQRIVEAKFPELDKKLAASAAQTFHTLRGEIERVGTATKNSSTSELLDGVKIMAYYQKPGGDIPEVVKVEYEQALAKDVETLQIFLRYNEELEKEEKSKKEKANEPIAAL